MRIGIDARAISTNRAGRGQYSRSLLRALGQCEWQNQYFLYTNAETSADSLPNNFHSRVVGARGILWHVLVAYRSRFVDKVDVYLALISPIVPALGLVRSVLVVHDIISFLKVARLPVKSKLTERLAFKWAFRRARRIIAVSNNTKRDVIRVFGVDGEKVATIPEAASSYLGPAERDSCAGMAEKYGIKGKYVLFVGTLEPRKNVAGLIEAYSLLPAGLQSEYQLVIAGMKGWNYKGMFKKVRELRLDDRVVFAGYVDDGDMPCLYSLAEAFVYPSLYEGFGLPPLEAMACGTPVITSNTSSLPEVVGDAGLLVDPRNITEIARSIEMLLTDETERQRLAGRGLEQARSFSWERAARDVLGVLTVACEG